MDQLVLIALVAKLVEEKLAAFPVPSRGQRGHTGPRGDDGADGHSFVWAEHEETVRALVREAALKFSDLTPEEVDSLRGQRGPEGPRGRDGRHFIFEEHAEQITAVIGEELERIKSDLKLDFSDLTEEDKEEIRGPRGHRGEAGRPFVFEEHREFFEGLKPKFSDFTEEERATLVLRFKHLSAEERAELKLTFSDLTDDEKNSIRGYRGQRGRAGAAGEQGVQGETGARGPQGVRGMPGPVGARGMAGANGRSGFNGRDGVDGADAPYITDIGIDQRESRFSFVFKLSNGDRFETESVQLPDPVNVFVANGIAGGGGGSGGSGADGKSAYEIWLEEGNVGTVQDFLDSLVGPQGPQGDPGPAGADGEDGEDGEDGAQGPQGDPGPPGADGEDGADGDSDSLQLVDCDADVFVRAAVRLDSSGDVESTMDEWLDLFAVIVLDFPSSTTILAKLAKADALANSNVAGLVESKPTATTCWVRIFGVTSDMYVGLDTDDEYYLSDEYAGLFVPSNLMPDTPGSVVVKIGQPLDLNRMILARGERTIIA